MKNNYLIEIQARRPSPLKELDQVHMDNPSIVETCRKLSKIIEGKSVLIIGDDDLMGLCFSKFCNPLEVFIVDVDERLINHIKKEKTRLDLNLSIKRYDIREELPGELRGKYDIFYTNPPYGSKNMGESCIAFIFRGIESLKVGGKGVFVIASKNQAEWARKAREKTIGFVKSNGCRLIKEWENLQTYKNNKIESSMFLIEKYYNTASDFHYTGFDLY